MMEEEGSVSCVFREILPTCNTSKHFADKVLSDTRIAKIKTCSEERSDNFSLENYQTLHYHKDCYSDYTSATKINRFKRKHQAEAKDQEVEDVPVKTTRSSTGPAFNFKELCLFCAEPCSVVPDTRHPDRWEKNPGILCKTAERIVGGKRLSSFKEVLLQVCDDRNDLLGDNVRIRVQGAASDLHAAEGRYHKNCYSGFVAVRSVHAASNKYDNQSLDKEPLNYIIRSIRNDPEGIWDADYLHTCYMKKGGSDTHITRFTNRLKLFLNDEVYFFDSPGISTVIMARDMAVKVLKVKATQHDDTWNDIHKVAKKIKSEIHAIPSLGKFYPVLNDEHIRAHTSKTLQSLLLAISPRFKEHEKVVCLITGMINTICNTRTSMLQVALGLLVDGKQLIEHLHEYATVSTYDETRRFKISAGSSGATQVKLDATKGMIQGISDNFDANLCTQNGVKQTHCMASIITQNASYSEERKPILRLTKAECKKATFDDAEIKVSIGEKTPQMPSSHAKVNVLPLKMLCQMVISREKAENSDFKFLKESVTQNNVPDYGGFNNKMKREEGQEIKPKSNIFYKPLIDKKPADPSTVLTAMHSVELTCTESGQEFTVFTCDQQLYRITLDIIWNEPERWKNFYPRLGGMHMLMNFIGSIGKMMDGSGLDKLMAKAFAGVDTMLQGKKYPMNLRALRFVVMELLHDILIEVNSIQDLLSTLDELSSKSLLAKHWVQNLIRPLFIAMLYVRAEREANFPLHYYAVTQMMPYIFAAGHWNYIRDGIYYIRSMERIPNTVLEHFLNGEHVVRLQDGLCNAVWSDNAIESTYMKNGKGPSGLIGQTTQERAVKIWANSHHLCGEVAKELENLRTKTKHKLKVHKEETDGRIRSDADDRRKIRQGMLTFIHPLKIETHSRNVLVNIYSGEESGDDVNVTESVTLGTDMMNKFQKSLPEGFREPLSSPVVTMKSGKKKNKKSNEVKPYNTELIIARILYLMSYGQMDMKTLFNYELAPVVTSLFEDSGQPRYPTSKSDLMNALKVEVSLRGIKHDAVVVDCGGMLHSAIYWPKDGMVSDLLKSIEKYAYNFISLADLYMIFDRYYERSIKSDTRMKRIDGFKRIHHLTSSSPLPAKEVCMSSIQTKKNLIEIIAEHLLQKFTDLKVQTNLVVTSNAIQPEQTNQGRRCKRDDLESYFDEADYLIPQQVEAAIKNGSRFIKVISADTDVFVLLCYHYQKRDWSQAEVYMKSFKDGNKIISIRKTVEKHADIIPSITAVHAISGCDSVPAMFNIGKNKALSVLKKMPLNYFGKIESEKDDVLKEGKLFVSKLYGMKDSSSSKNRLLLWKKKTDSAKLTAKPPALKYLPPTDEALELNLCRGNHQGILWDKCVLGGNLPPIDPELDGWDVDPETGVLKPMMLPNGTIIAPEEVLRIVKCTCTVTHCRTLVCSCHKSNFPCTPFCSCECIECENPFNRNNAQEEEEEEAGNELGNDEDVDISSDERTE